jgi:hypothetical protein
LTFGDATAFTNMEEVPIQASQIQEKSIYICPTAGNTRVLLVGKIRIEVCREMRDYNNHESPPNRSNEISHNPDFNSK